MANKFDRVLSGEEITSAINDGFNGDLFDLAARVEQAVLAKLAEQEPVAWTSAEIMSGPSFVDDDDYAVMYKTKSHLLDEFCGYPEATPVPLYAHPMPSASQTTDKTACVSESVESDTQNNALPDGTFINEGTKHLERIKRFQKWRRGEDKTMAEADIHPKEIGESLDWLIAFAENHIEEARDMVGATQKITLKVDARHVSNYINEELNKISDKWQLVPKQATDEAYLGFSKVNDLMDRHEFNAAYEQMLEDSPVFSGESQGDEFMSGYKKMLEKWSELKRSNCKNFKGDV